MSVHPRFLSFSRGLSNTNSHWSLSPDLYCLLSDLDPHILSPTFLFRARSSSLLYDEASQGSKAKTYKALCRFQAPCFTCNTFLHCFLNFILYRWGDGGPSRTAPLPKVVQLRQGLRTSPLTVEPVFSKFGRAILDLSIYLSTRLPLH